MTLTDISYYVRKYAPYVVVIILSLLIVVYAIKLVSIFISPKNKSSIQVDPIFGKIKRPNIPDSTSSAGFNFKLDTIEGEPMTATPTAKVFFLSPPTTKFNYRENLSLIAKTMEFDMQSAKYELQETEGIFTDDNQQLDINISNFNFSYNFLFEKMPDIFSDAISPKREDAIRSAVDFLTAIRYPAELAQGKNTTTFLYYDSKNKAIAILPDNRGANIVEIDFYRPDVEQYPIVSPKYFTSQNRVFLSFTDTGGKVLRAQVRFFEKADDQVGIYPLKTGVEAFNSLKAGKGIVIHNSSDAKNITIKKMFLGYFDPDTYQNYLQPVYVFLGENKFVAYVPAVVDNYLTE